MKNEKKILVSYFSCSGVTKKLAQTLADTVGADLYEIEPEIAYTKADLNWMDKRSRSTVEMHDLSSRPAIAGKLSNMDDYDIVFVGFPIWWYIAPAIINTFLESYDFSGKIIVPFCTSGGSGTGETDKILHALGSESARWRPSELLSGRATKETLLNWVNRLNL